MWHTDFQQPPTMGVRTACLPAVPARCTVSMVTRQAAVYVCVCKRERDREAGRVKLHGGGEGGTEGDLQGEGMEGTLPHHPEQPNDVRARLPLRGMDIMNVYVYMMHRQGRKAWV